MKGSFVVIELTCAVIVAYFITEKNKLFVIYNDIEL